MRTFPALSRTHFARFAAAACLAISARQLPAEPVAAIYGFAQQKVYGMTISATPGSSARLVADPAGFTVAMSTQAAADTVPGGSAFTGGLDAPQAFIGSGTPGKPVENYSGNAPAGLSFPANERVLLQLNATPPGVPGGFDSSIPQAGDFFAGRNFARSDVYATPDPDTTIGPNGSGSVPANVPPGTWPLNGSGVPGGKLFADVGTPGTLSIDVAAESLLDSESFATLAGGMAEWTVSGRFRVDGSQNSRAAVSFDFNLTERLAVYSWQPTIDVATASNTLSFDVFDATGRSVFGPFLGANPANTRMLSTQAVGSLTYNNNTAIPTHVYPGPVNVNFQTLPLAPGNYAFMIKGGSSVHVTAVPEPATGSLLAAASLCGLVARWRRRRPVA